MSGHERKVEFKMPRRRRFLASVRRQVMKELVESHSLSEILENLAEAVDARAQYLHDHYWEHGGEKAAKSLRGDAIKIESCAKRVKN